jgi:2,4-dienoyl-CoA reductase-like NADH-dependent reductase (Old Yellow Enzyme family)
VTNISLFDPFALGPLKLPNRIVMPALTRSRAGVGDAPTAMNAEYYAQRAGAGLIISEASQVSQQGKGYLFTPGIYTEDQVTGWKLVTDAVHVRGGHIFQQLMHAGRISHVTLQPGGQAPISSTEQPAVHTVSFAYDEDGNPKRIPASRPRVATIEELHQVTRDFVHAARNSQRAGFDGVEIHGANGFLIDQHLHSLVNRRGDEYGPVTPESRTRLLLEIFDAVAAVHGADRTGVRIGPFGVVGDMGPDPRAEETFLYLGAQLSRRRSAYVHIVRGSQYDPKPLVPDIFLGSLKEVLFRPVIATGRLDRIQAEMLLTEGLADLVGFGHLYIANPDLVERVRNGWPLSEPDPATYYVGGARGYIDYPSYE